MRLRPLSQSYGTPKTRRHPRTLAEAWPQDYADPIEHLAPPPRSWLWSDIVIAALLVGVLVALAMGVL